MFYCKNCEYEGDYVSAVCPNCGITVTLDEDEIEDRKNLLLQAIDAKEFEAIAENYHILADAGITEAEREYAKIVEAGKYVRRDYDLAEDYFYRAAKKNDPEAAYRYSRIVERQNSNTGRFWLIYSAILGHKDAFIPLAEEFSRLGMEDDAHYFFYLASLSGKADSIVTMAERYYNGIGTEPSPEYAKWYMDKLTVPPIYAIKLAYKLRQTTAKTPPDVTLANYDALLAKLLLEARSCGFSTAEFYLTELLSTRGNVSALTSLGKMKIEGKNCAQDTEEGLRCLFKAAAAESEEANIYLGDLYIEGKSLPRDVGRAIASYEKAGKLGDSSAYLRIADLYFDGKEVERNNFAAIDYYKIAEDLGNKDAREKRAALLEEQTRCLLEAKKYDRYGSYEDAFRYAALSCDAGSSEAAILLGKYFAEGLGTKQNRRHAYLWYRFAAERGETSALYPLGICYLTGFGINRDYVSAKNILIRAEKEGDGRAKDVILSMMKRKLEKTERRIYSTAMRLIHKRKFSEAIRFLDVAKDLGHGKSIYTLGCFYEFGIFIRCDKDKAFSLYETAYAVGFRDPRANYKLKVLKMIR